MMPCHGIEVWEPRLAASLSRPSRGKRYDSISPAPSFHEQYKELLQLLQFQIGSSFCI